MAIKNVEINLVTIKDFFAKFSKNLTWVFFAMFLLLVVFEIFVIKNSVNIALNLNEVTPTRTEKGVRINFDGYKTAVDRIKATKDFYPSGGIRNDPFSVPVVSTEP
jgi:hypothetical protein